jgi:WD40 repeat protein
MRLPRFTTLQLLLAATLVALVLGLFTSSWRVSAFHHIQQVAFSPSGKLLAVRYASGAVQVYQLDAGRPRLVARAFGQSYLGYDASTVHWLDDDKLLKLEPNFDSADYVTRVRELTVSTRAVREVARLSGYQAFPGMQLAGGGRVLFIDWRQTGDICGFNLRTQKPDRQWKLGSAASDMALSADGRTLAISDQSGQVHIFDVEKDQPQQKLAAGGSGGILSADGRLFALPRARAAANGMGMVSLFSVQQPGLSRDLVTQLGQIDCVELSADGSRLAALGDGALEYYDATTNQRLARLALNDPQPGSSILPGFSMKFGGHQAALSPDGQLLATFAGGQVFLRELPGGKLAHVLTGGPRWLHVVIFTLGFAAWAAAWGIVAKRSRLPLGLLDVTGQQAALARPVPAVRSPISSISVMLAWIFVLVLALVVISSLGQPFSGQAILQTLTSLGVGVAGVVALGLTFFWGVRLVMGPHHFTLLRLRQVAATPGRLFHHGNAQIWFAVPSKHEAEVGRVYDEVAGRARELFPTHDGTRSVPATLVAWLDRQCDLDAFVGRHVPIAAIVPDVWSARTAMICEETALRNFTDPLKALRAALALMFTIRQKRGLLPGWVGGLISREACRGDETPTDERAAIRRLKVLVARRPEWNPLAVIKRPAVERTKLWLGLDEAAAWVEVHAESDFVVTLAPLLLGQEAPPGRRERVLAWLRAIKPKDDPMATLTSALGISEGELLAEWRAAFDRATGLPYDAPSPDRQAEIQALITSQILDRSQPADDRARATRALGGTSYAGAAGVLIELLADRRCEFRGEVVRSLENLSGLALGDDPSAWQAWWQALPPGVRWEPAATPDRESPSLLQSTRTENAVAAGPPPLELKLVWGLMAIGGLAALAIPITFLFVVGPVVFVTLYFSLFVGMQAIAKGASRETRGLAGAANLQAINVIACDPINLLLAGIEHALLRRPQVRYYLDQVTMAR